MVWGGERAARDYYRDHRDRRDLRDLRDRRDRREAAINDCPSLRFGLYCPFGPLGPFCLFPHCKYTTIESVCQEFEPTIFSKLFRKP